MVIEIKKNTSPEEVKKILDTLNKNNKKPEKDISDFFGKIPDMEDGLSFLRKVRNKVLKEPNVITKKAMNDATKGKSTKHKTADDIISFLNNKILMNK